MSEGRKPQGARGARSTRAVFWLLAGAAGCSTAPAPTPASPAAAPAASATHAATGAPAPRADAIRAACDRTRRCAGFQPICLTSPAGSRCGTLAEADALPHDGAQAALACSAPADCATGERCCTNPLWDRTRCTETCDPANEAELCEADADCTGKVRCRGSAGKAPLGALPAWVKTCSAE